MWAEPVEPVCRGHATGSFYQRYRRGSSFLRKIAEFEELDGDIGDGVEVAEARCVFNGAGARSGLSSGL